MDQEIGVLVSKIREGNRKAFKKLFLHFYEPLCKFAWSYVHSSHIAEELVQDLFLELWEEKETLDPQKNIKAFLYTSVRNKALNHQKHEKLAEEYNSDINWVNKPASKQKHQFDQPSDFAQAAKKAIEELPPGARKIYRLSRTNGLTYKEIAQVLDISPKTVESQMSRTLKKLRDKLEKYHN